MIKRFAPLMLLVIMLSSILAACGSSTGGGDDALPVYNGAKSIALTDELKKNQSIIDGQKRGAKFELYSSGDDPTKIKTFYADELKKKGWIEDNSIIGGSSTGPQIEQLGGFVLAYTKGEKAVFYLALPKELAGFAGITGLGEKDLLITVSSGTKASLIS